MADPSLLTVVQLKEALKCKGLSQMGTKAELVQRLVEADPEGGWIRPGENAVSNVDEQLAEARKEIQEQREELFRREREVARRELEAARRERDNLREDDGPGGGRGARNGVVRFGMNFTAELLGRFDGNNEDFANWERQVQLTRRRYNIDEETLHMMITMRLMGKAETWYRSDPEYINMSVDELLIEMRKFFANRICDLALQRKFEGRIWRRGEVFADYLHDKMVLANQARVTRSKLMAYIIEGIPDLVLQDQARTHRFQSTDDIRDAFGDIVLRMRTWTGVGTRNREPVKVETNERKVSEKKCFICGKGDHLSNKCTVKDQGIKCFACGSFGHISRNCTSKINGKEINTVNIVTNDKIFKDMYFENNKISVMIDTGSDLSLLNSRVLTNVKVNINNKERISYRGLGSNTQMTLGKCKLNVKMDDDDYTVEFNIVNNLLNYDAIIGNDFLNTVDFYFKNGKFSMESRVCNLNKDVAEILAIDDVKENNIKDLDLTHVADKCVRERVTECVRMYEPKMCNDAEIEMKVILKDEIPVYQRPRRLSEPDKIFVRQQIDEWLSQGIIGPSKSDYASPVVIVKKKNGQNRLCVDFRKLNEKVIKDRFPLPLIEDQIDALQGAKIFSTLDLKNGFFHVPINEKSRKYMSFIIPDGQFEFFKSPFGFCNAPAVFQRYIASKFKKLILERKVLTYIDDLIIPASDMETAVRYLEEVLSTASEAGLVINWNKCHLLTREVEYLGYIISEAGVKPNSVKLKSVQRFPEPVNAKGIQSFLGLTGYFRKFIPQYAMIARPLSNLLRDGVAFEFGVREREAFNKLKNELCKEPVLQLYDAKKETELHTDASKYGYGAVLMQRERVDGHLHPVYYASGKTTAAEEKYSSYELEVLAIIKALRKFRVYLLGLQFTIVTDCQAFTMTMKKQDLCVRIARYALLLEEFNYKIIHRPGSRMQHVDALSRNPIQECMLISREHESLVMQIQRTQQDDDEITRIKQETKKKPMDDFLIKNNILFKFRQGQLLLVVPKKMQSEVTRAAHELGHFGVNKTEELLLREYWFTNLRQKVESVVKNCIKCILSTKKTGKQEGFLHSLDKGSVPLDTYHIDHLGPLASTKKSYQYIFYVIDAFSKFSWLYATKTCNSTEVIDKLTKQSRIFGNPRRIISDRGSAFMSNDFKTYCMTEKIEHVQITTGVPRANGQVERANRTIIPILTKMSIDKPSEWFKYLSPVQMCLNAVSNRSTGKPPFSLMFGVAMKRKSDDGMVRMIQEEEMRMFDEERDCIREQARKQILKVQETNSKSFNKSRRIALIYKIGDLVAVRRTAKKPGQKFVGSYLGPYEVSKVLRNDRYLVDRVGEHEGPKSTTTMAEYMKPWSNYASRDDCDDE